MRTASTCSHWRAATLVVVGALGAPVVALAESPTQTPPAPLRDEPLASAAVAADLPAQALPSMDGVAVAALSPTPPAVLTPSRALLTPAPRDSQPSATPGTERPPTLPRDAHVAAAADGATTLLVLQSGGFEMNGFMPVTPLGIVGATVLKLGLASQLERLPEHQRDRGIQTTTAVWGGAAANNLLAWAAVSPPVAIGAGLITAWVLWTRTGEKLEAQRLARAAQPSVSTDTVAAIGSTPASTTAQAAASEADLHLAQADGGEADAVVPALLSPVWTPVIALQ